MSEILVKARELGEMLVASQELSRLKKAEAILESDDHGMALLEDQRLLQVELIKAAREGNSEVQLEDITNLLKEKQNEINAYPKTSEYIEAKNQFDSLVKSINDVITFAITGEACSPSKCSSCGGGCGSH
ncbi:MAG: YlbF family regulator [Clostridiaceae bacterium]|nr:YlbF family regulator [Clostridiaceae bacterium]